MPSPGEIWTADSGHETRNQVFVISDARFHRLAERAVVAPVIDVPVEARRPWHIGVDPDRVAAVNLLATVPIDRLLERVAPADAEALSVARRAARFIVG
eukprot:gene32916-biopygen25219